MSELNQDHFHVHDSNKAKSYEKKKAKLNAFTKKKRINVIKNFIDECSDAHLTEIHAEVLRLKGYTK